MNVRVLIGSKKGAFVLESGPEVGDKLQHASLRLRGKILRDIELAEGLADVAVNRRRPASTGGAFRRAGQRLAVTLKFSWTNASLR